MHAAKLGQGLQKLADDLQAMDTELEATVKTGKAPRAEIPAQLRDMAAGCDYFASWCATDPNGIFVTYVYNLEKAAEQCRGYADQIERIIKAGGALDAGWNTALDFSCVWAASAAAATPF